MTTRDFQTEFDNLIKEIINPTLKNLGFKKNARNYKKIVNDIVQVFNIQKSQWNSADEITFTFNIGFFNSEIFFETQSRSLPNYPKEYDCFLNVGFAKWYKMNKSISYESLKNEIQSEIETNAVEIFTDYESLKSLSGLIKKKNITENTMGILNMFTFLMKTNNAEDGIKLLKKHYIETLKPKQSTTTFNYPNGQSKTYESTPKINEEAINRLKSIAKLYQINIE
jgi:hypothetical protein